MGSPVLLDFAFYGTTIPTSLYNYLLPIFKLDAQDFVSCNLHSNDYSLDFGFGGPEGPIIAVPYSELVIPAYDDHGNLKLTAQGKPACCWTLQSGGINDSTSPEFCAFGQTFLRSAYLLHDFDNMAIDLAQTNFSSTNSSNALDYDSTSINKYGVVWIN